MSNSLKNKLGGDGLALYEAVRNSGMKIDDFLLKVDVVKQTLYNHYKEKELDSVTKTMYAKALSRTVEDIFSDKPTPEDLQATWGKKKGEVIALGKKVPTRLTAEDHKDAFPNWEGVPVYNVEVSASFVDRYSDEQNKWEPLYYLRDPQFRECDFAARIAGDSMHSEIRHGDYIICQEVQDRNIIIYGEIYYVVTSNGLETCKYVNAMPIYNEDKSDKRKMYDYDRVLLVPKNDNISPTPLHKNDIIRLYKVKGIVRGY